MFPRIGRGGLAADFNAICCANSCERLCAVPLVVKGIERHRTNAPHQDAGQRSVVGSHTPFVLCACASQTAAHGTCSAMQWLCHPKLSTYLSCFARRVRRAELGRDQACLRQLRVGHRSRREAGFHLQRRPAVDDENRLQRCPLLGRETVQTKRRGEMMQRDDARVPRPLVGSSGPIIRSISPSLVSCRCWPFGVCCEDTWSSCGKP